MSTKTCFWGYTLLTTKHSQQQVSGEHNEHPPQDGDAAPADTEDSTSSPSWTNAVEQEGVDAHNAEVGYNSSVTHFIIGDIVH